jgi:hypothetical protein
MLLQLLRGTTVALPNPAAYFRLPQVSGADSYHFQLGCFAELGTCSKDPRHGHYQRKISPDQLERLIQWCKSAPQIDLVAEQEKIFPRPTTLPQPKRKQQHYVHVYNPDNLPLKDVLTIPSTFEGRSVLAVGYDLITTRDFRIGIPYVYSIRDSIISGCPKCRRQKERVANKPSLTKV